MSMCSEINRRRGVKRRDEFPPFSSQPRKSPRLDCQFSPEYEQGGDKCEGWTEVQNDDGVRAGDVMVDRALVLFQPADLLRSPSSPLLEIKVHPDLVEVLRNYQYQITGAYTPEAKDQTINKTSTASNLAVIPWVDPNIIEQSKSTFEPMEADDDLEMMDTDECRELSNTSEGLQQHQHQQPQHCLPIQVSQNISSPVHWL